MSNNIPAMPAEWAPYWRGPDRSEIVFQGPDAVMTHKAFDMLLDYTGTMPTGVYDGKMWKTRLEGSWYLRWYSTPRNNPNKCIINTRPIKLQVNLERTA